MNLIAILICIVVQRFLNFGSFFNDVWFAKYLHWFLPIIQKKNKWLGLAIIIAPIFLLLLILHYILMPHFFGLLYLILSCIILFFCIDAKDFRKYLKTYFEKPETLDEQIAKTIATKYNAIEVNYTNHEVHRAITKAILVKAFEKLFSGLFWFAILGVYGVTTYFILTLLGKIATNKQMPDLKDLTQLAYKIQQIADWLPTRILILTFAAGGQLRKTFSYLIHNFKNSYKYNEKFIIEAGLIAIDANIKNLNQATEQENHNALNLIDRALIFWIILIGVISLTIML